MRNERWVNRFHYAWNNTLFFDPLDVYYEPRADHFLASLDEHKRALFRRSGIWWSHRHNRELPAQGWKIHVSAEPGRVREVAAKVIDCLTARRVDFKIALDVNIYEILNSKAMARGGGGKLVTVYPRDDEEFRSCLADLAERLEGIEGPYVLSDLRYKDHRTLYFRYGQFLDTHEIDVLGRRVPHIQGPDGPVQDIRRPGNAHPDWVAWPFDDWKPEQEPEGDGLLGGRFRVTGAIQFSNSGGVYTAQDTLDGDRKVVLKEARPHTNPNLRQAHDAVEIQAREWQFLNRLADEGSFPVPIARFQHWEHHFIAMEFLPGADIRAVLLDRNPLTRPGSHPERSAEFLKLYLDVFRELATTIHAAHQRGVVLGDFTPANVLIDTETHRVSIVDLEACRLLEPEHAAAEQALSRPVELFTPGFSLSRNKYRLTGPESDLFGLATSMAYFVFPIAAMSYLRENVLENFGVFFEALGWPESVHRLVTDLAAARVGLPEVLEALSDEEALLGAVRAPAVPVVDEERMGWARTEAEVAAFVAAVADPERATLFPVDPFTHISNPLSLGFGASGVLWALNASGAPIEPQWRDWLERAVDDMRTEAHPDGLMTGLAGIAWAADSLGLREQARRLLARANERAPEVGDHSFYYGLSGVGMTNLRFHLSDGDPRHLEAARECARALRESAVREDGTAHWRNAFTREEPLSGLGYGQAGVALFLLRMHQITGEDGYLRLGREALAFEMSRAGAGGAASDDREMVTFAQGGTVEPYVEVGAAGVLQVLLRYGDLDRARAVARGLDFRFSVLPAYGFGISGVADALLDAADFTGDPSYRTIALRQLDYVRSTFLFEPDPRFGLPREAGQRLLGVPGEGMTRCATDYLTGSAGVLRVLHRVNNAGGADFLLDEAAP
ncbi:class III lanthionine synthetase LanKC [Streptomyces sp. XM4193]|uniref:class III lanthionine synthetase LanKC n=1 Tax=Streptomyces sp. XM4193 TaxID=2929782 RepID=UPI001FF8FF6C|nr:class III lanthionine synthetase LanKC [Streptomyces sp. XM4193]MCK1798038.1 class III lanthionine synthetase LanKC [Streptomyces sp. XM4193]